MEESKFKTLINNLSVVAEKENWRPTYDKTLDNFYWTRQPVSRQAKLVKVSHETSLYLNRRGKVEGVLVEYVNSNFVSHNPAYKLFLKQFTKKASDGRYTVGNSKTAEKYMLGLAEALRADIYQDAHTSGRRSCDLDGLLAYAHAA